MRVFVPNFTHSAPIIELVTQQIERLSLKSFQWLSFPAVLEGRFEKDESSYESGRLWVEGLVAIALFNIFLFVNYSLLHTMSWRDLVVRSGLITPIALVINFVILLKVRRTYRELSISMATCWMCYAHLYLELGTSAMGPTYAQVGVIVAILFTNVVIRLRIRYALLTSIMIMIGDLVYLAHDHLQGSGEKVFGATLTVCAVAMTLMANYSLGREQRLAYLLRLRGEIQSAQLSTSNVELERISRSDSLTGLANRHAFGIQYKKIWKEALTSRAPLSAVLIDIDNFKTVNDLCGHLYGDQVLKRVAMLLQQALRGKADFAARFGGEEFVLLLPGASPETAMMVAERIRKLVEVAGAPALEEGAELPVAWSTVSCGVATCWPTHTDTQDDLLGAADKALYEAKASGRNRVCYGEMAMQRAFALTSF